MWLLGDKVSTLSYDSVFCKNYLPFEKNYTPSRKKKFPLGVFCSGPKKIYPWIHKVWEQQRSKYIGLWKPHPLSLNSFLCSGSTPFLFDWSLHIKPQSRRTNSRIIKTLWSRDHFFEIFTTTKSNHFILRKLYNYLEGYSLLSMRHQWSDV